MGNELTKEQKILVLETQIKERALIIYVNESAIADGWGTTEKEKGYEMALKDEIKNHQTAIEEYKEELKKLTT